MGVQLLVSLLLGRRQGVPRTHLAQVLCSAQHLWVVEHTHKPCDENQWFFLFVFALGQSHYDPQTLDISHGLSMMYFPYKSYCANMKEL